MVAGRLSVEVACALPERQETVTLQVDPGTTLLQAVERSGLAARHGIDPARARLGVFGRLRAPDDPVRDGDRVEIYRPLARDPKQARRRRAAASRGAIPE